MSAQSKTSETDMTARELAETLMQLYSAAMDIGAVDLARLERKLHYLNDVGESVAPISMAATAEHLAHVERLVILCRPIQEEMKRAPRPRRRHDYGSFIA